MNAIEITEIFDKLLEKSKEWDKSDIIDNTIKVGEDLIRQIEEKYMEDDKYRVDRNELIVYFESIKRTHEMNLPFSEEHYTQLIERVKKRIRPYPHYSGIKLQFPDI